MPTGASRIRNVRFIARESGHVEVRVPRFKTALIPQHYKSGIYRALFKSPVHFLTSAPRLRANPTVVTVSRTKVGELDSIYSDRVGLEAAIRDMFEPDRQKWTKISVDSVDRSNLEALLASFMSNIRGALSMIERYRDRAIAAESANSAAKDDLRYWQIRSWVHAVGNKFSSLSAMIQVIKQISLTADRHSRVIAAIRDIQGSLNVRAIADMASGLNVKIEYGENRAEILQNMPEWFDEIIANLLGNTAKNAPEGQPAYLMIEYDPSRRTFAFMNNTPPIPRDVHKKIGVEAVHGNASHRGTGNGLLVDFNIARLNGGKMWVDRGVDADPARGIAEKGPTFYIQLPPAIPLAGTDAEFEAFIARVATMTQEKALEASVQLFDVIDGFCARMRERLLASEDEAYRFAVIEERRPEYNRLVRIVSHIEKMAHHSLTRAFSSSYYQAMDIFKEMFGGLDEPEASRVESIRGALRVMSKLGIYRRVISEGEGYEVARSRGELAGGILHVSGFYEGEIKWIGDELLITSRGPEKISEPYLDLIPWPPDPKNNDNLKKMLSILGWDMVIVCNDDGTHTVRLNFGKTLLK